MKSLVVHEPIKTRSGEVYYEPKADAYGRVVMLDGSTKRIDQVKASDEWHMDPVPLGRVINSALDRPDDRLTAEERRKRWCLSVRIEEAMGQSKPLELSREDENRIASAADGLTNVLFLGRIHEALDQATPVKKSK
jgi:hypothetical protein